MATTKKKKAVTPRKRGAQPDANGKYSTPTVFTEAQSLFILQWLAEGLTVREMNERAAAMRPPFILTPPELYYWRTSRQVDIAMLKKMRESEVMNTGFALRERRVEALNSLSMKIFQELSAEKGSKLWLAMAKGIGSGADYERIDYKEFNKAEVDALRSLLDDIATEVGGRVRRTDITTKDQPISGSGLDPKLWKTMTDDELAILERAAKILERSASDPSSSASD